MPFVAELFEQPRFRPEVTVRLTPSGADIDYRSQGCHVDFPAEAGAEGALLLGLLRVGGRSSADLARECPGFAPALPGIIADLDHLGLLTESDLGVRAEYVSGRQCYRELLRFAERMKARVARSAYFGALVDGTITRSQLIGYALEYWHLVKRAPALLAPALGNVETETTERLLTSFLVSELHHDRLLASALAAVDVPTERLAELQPLPMTFALCATLGALARQHPLAFKAVLFLFEQPYPEFNQAFRVACERLGLPGGFARPIVKHSELNEEGEHDDISAALLAEVPVVSREEQTAVKKHLAVLVEQMVLQEDAVLRTYAEPAALTSRFFS